MKIQQELEEIKNKDLSNMTEKELKDYKAYLTDYNKNAEKRAKTKLWKLLYWVCGTPLIFFGLSALMCSVLNIKKDLSLIPMITSYVILFVCFGIVGVFSLLRKKSIKNVEIIKQVCNEKLTEADRRISILEFRKDIVNFKDAQTADLQVVSAEEDTVVDLSN